MGFRTLFEHSIVLRVEQSYIKQDHDIDTIRCK